MDTSTILLIVVPAGSLLCAIILATWVITHRRRARRQPIPLSTPRPFSRHSRSSNVLGGGKGKQVSLLNLLPLESTVKEHKRDSSQDNFTLFVTPPPPLSPTSAPASVTSTTTNTTVTTYGFEPTLPTKSKQSRPKSIKILPWEFPPTTWDPDSETLFTQTSRSNCGSDDDETKKQRRQAIVPPIPSPSDSALTFASTPSGTSLPYAVLSGEAPTSRTGSESEVSFKSNNAIVNPNSQPITGLALASANLFGFAIPLPTTPMPVYNRFASSSAPPTTVPTPNYVPTPLPASPSSLNMPKDISLSLSELNMGHSRDSSLALLRHTSQRSMETEVTLGPEDSVSVVSSTISRGRGRKSNDDKFKGKSRSRSAGKKGKKERKRLDKEDEWERVIQIRSTPISAPMHLYGETREDLLRLEDQRKRKIQEQIELEARDGVVESGSELDNPASVRSGEGSEQTKRSLPLRRSVHMEVERENARLMRLAAKSMRRRRTRTAIGIGRGVSIEVKTDKGGATVDMYVERAGSEVNKGQETSQVSPKSVTEKRDRVSTWELRRQNLERDRRELDRQEEEMESEKGSVVSSRSWKRRSRKTLENDQNLPLLSFPSSLPASPRSGTRMLPRSPKLSPKNHDEAQIPPSPSFPSNSLPASPKSRMFPRSSPNSPSTISNFSKSELHTLSKPFVFGPGPSLPSSPRLGPRTLPRSPNSGSKLKNPTSPLPTFEALPPSAVEEQ